MTDYATSSPYYYRTKSASSLRTHPVAVPNFQKGRAAGNVASVLNWIANVQGANNDTSDAIRKVLAEKISDQIRKELVSTGHRGYLLNVTRYSHIENGALHSRVDGPQPVGSGNSAADALARSIVTDTSGKIVNIPQGYQYDQARSFSVWVETNEDGDLIAKTSPYPQSLYQEAQRRIVDGVVVQGKLDTQLQERARKYDAIAKEIKQRKLADETQNAIASLQRTHKNLGDSVARADRLLQQAQKHQERAALIGTIATALQVAGYAIDYFENSKQSSASVEEREKEKQTFVNQYNIIEIRLQKTIIQTVPDINVAPVAPLLP